MSEHTASLHLNPLVPLYVCTTADRYQRTEHDLSTVTHYLARSSLPPPHRLLPHCCCARAHPSVQPPFITSCSSTCISSPLFNDHTPNRPLQISRVSVLWKHTPHLARAGSHLCPRLLISLILSAPIVCQRRPLRPLLPVTLAALAAPPSSNAASPSFHHSRTLVLVLK